MWTYYGFCCSLSLSSSLYDSLIRDMHVSVSACVQVPCVGKIKEEEEILLYFFVSEKTLFKIFLDILKLVVNKS